MDQKRQADKEIQRQKEINSDLREQLEQKGMVIDR